VNLAQGHYLGVRANTKSNRSVLFVHALESALLLRKGTPHEDRFQIDPLSLDDIQFCQVLINTAEALFELFNLIGETVEVSAFFERRNQTLVVTNLSNDFLPLFDERSLATV
jgi:hypothetical protein